MRFVTLLLSCSLLSLVIAPLHAASNEIAAEPNPITPGQTVTLRWYFTGDKVVVSGGRFGKGAVVTGRTSLTDKPAKTTRYTFNVWYRSLAPSPKTVKQERMPLHARYSVMVEVVSGLSSYRDRYGWQINYLAGWKRDNVPLADPANNGLMFFQKEDDSVERLAVSILPAKEMTSADLIQKVQADLSSHYNEVEIVSQSEATYADVPAAWMVFSGLDETHPGTRTQSVVLALVREGHAYVVSARTSAAQFKARQALLEKMIRSFAFVNKAVRASQR